MAYKLLSKLLVGNLLRYYVEHSVGIRFVNRILVRYGLVIQKFSSLITDLARLRPSAPYPKLQDLTCSEAFGPS